MPTVEYPTNPNTDTAFVTDDGGKRTRSLKTVLVDGTIDYPKNANVKDCYVTIDGKKQRALMTADVSKDGVVEYQDGSNSTKGYVTVDGKKHRVVLTAVLAGGAPDPVIAELNVTPSTSAQTITAPEGTDGYSPVNVSAVTASIDANIQAGNIKKDVTILGVTGSYEAPAPTGTINITTNGTHDVSSYATADVNVPTTAPDHYISFNTNSNGDITSTTTSLNLNGVRFAGNFLQYKCYNDTTVTQCPDFSTLKGGIIDHIYSGCTNMTGNVVFGTMLYISQPFSMQEAFKGTKITSVVFPNDHQDGSAFTPSYCFKGAFQDCTSLTTVTFPNRASSGSPQGWFSSCFKGCTNLVNVINMAGFFKTGTMLYGCEYMFYDCTSLESIDLSSFSNVYSSGANSMFYRCTALKNVNLKNLKAINQSSAVSSMFYGCTALKKLKLESLYYVNQSVYGWFSKCDGLEVYFYALTNYGTNSSNWSGLFGGNANTYATNCTAHFPMALANTTFASWSLGGISTTKLFDIVTSITGADTNVYARQEKDSTSTATAWVLNNVLYYTSGTTEPQVGNTIYSDSACTTAVTTISSIA